jgi:hypothetical protein
MSSRNQDNRLKCDVAGFKGWRKTLLHDKKNPDGSFNVTPGFKNVLTDQEVFAKEPPGPTGDLACVRHSSDAYRQGYEQIRWDR